MTKKTKRLPEGNKNPIIDDADIELLRIVLSEMPTNWCDPLLTGPKGLGQGPWGCQQIERLLHAIKERMWQQAMVHLLTTRKLK